MNEKLHRLFERVKTESGFLTVSEAQTSQGIVLPILNALEWDVFNTNEVTPEYSVGGKRVEFALRIQSHNKVFLEIKKTSENLDNHQEQLVYYAFQQGVRLAILTNGITWQFYLPLEEGSWEQRRFFTIDLLAQGTADSIEKFEKLLLRSGIESGTAYESAKHLFEGRQRNKIVKESLPKAWWKLVSEPDEMLVELVNDTLEKICGYKAETNVISDFLKNGKAVPLGTSPISRGASTPKVIQTPVAAVVSVAEPHSIKLDADKLEDLLHTKVIEARLGDEVLPNTWRGILHAGMVKALGKGFTVGDLQSKLRVNFNKGNHTNQGFGPIEGTNFSWQNQDANKSAFNVVKVARILNCELLVLFEWREKGKYPHARGLIHVKA